MSLQLNTAEARKADNFASVIKETGKYIGVITRAEKLLSRNNVEGVGLSFKADDGATANYLDLYTVKPDGTQLYGYNLVQALLCCARVKDAAEGQIKFEKWTRDQGIVETTATGYPSLMGKRIGFILQQVLDTNPETGKDTDKMAIVAVFEASTGLTSTEIIEGKTKAESIDKRLKATKPVYDKRKKDAASLMRGVNAASTGATGGAADQPFIDDYDNIKF